MTKVQVLRKDQAGAAAIEFALAVPVLVSFVWGIFQVGLLFQANAGMQHALGEGARFATLCIPTGDSCALQTDANIKSTISAKLFGKSDGSFTVFDPVTTTTGGSKYKTLKITYTRGMNFLFFQGPNVTLTRQKIVYTPT